MRHRWKKPVLDRKAGPRRALIRGLATNLIVSESITTTDGKAKALRPYVEKLITHAKKKTLTNERYLAKYLYTKKAVTKAMEVIGPRYAQRAGRYTRTVKIGFRPGDGASMVTIELV